MQWKSGTYKDIDKEFFLNEMIVRKLSATILSHAGKLKYKTSVRYKVFRKDGSFYHSSSVDEVLEDDNASKKKISRLVIELLRLKDKEGDVEDDDELMFIDFDTNYGDSIHYEINEKSNRDWCFLFMDDLELQVNRSIYKSAWDFLKKRWFEGLLYLITMILMSIGIFMLFPEHYMSIILGIQSSPNSHILSLGKLVSHIPHPNLAAS